MKHKKFTVHLYQETHTTFEITADSQEEAEELVLSGEFDDDNVKDVTVKNSEIIK